MNRLKCHFGHSELIFERKEFEKSFEGMVQTRLAVKEDICEELSRADLVIGAVLVPGAAAPSEASGIRKYRKNKNYRKYRKQFKK